MEETKQNIKDASINLIPRPPIVVVMGHIDHGKTTLLDYIRKANVAEKESGGITQHIGAYEAEIPRQARDDFSASRKITFIDTPGHEAFSKMRSRGAKIADVAILVVAADDGIKAQTLEAIDAIKKAKIPFIVALNKIDKENADPEKVKRELAEKEIYLEGMGGNIPCVNVSSKTGQGVDELLEMILLVAEMEELKGDAGLPASGTVIESHLDPKRGIAATLVIQNGTLEKKTHINANGAIAPVKIFEDFTSKPIDKATFSAPVKIIGFDKLPEVGASFQSFKSKTEAEAWQEENKSQIANAKSNYAFQNINQPASLNGPASLPIIIKADASGSLEAIEKEIEKLASNNKNVSVNILRLNVGDITENDVKLASSGEQPVIIGFKVKAAKGATQFAERSGVILMFFDIIYHLEEWLENEIKKRTPIQIEEEEIGKASLIRIFKQEKNKQIIGGEVVSGKIANEKYVRVIRRGAIIAKGKIIELQQNKIKISEIDRGKQFGALLEIKELKGELAKNDTIEIYDIKTRQ